MPNNPGFVVQKPFVSELVPFQCGLMQIQKYLRKAASNGHPDSGSKEWAGSWAFMGSIHSSLWGSCCVMLLYSGNVSWPLPTWQLAQWNAYPLEGCAKSLQLLGLSFVGNGARQAGVGSTLCPSTAWCRGPKCPGQSCHEGQREHRVDGGCVSRGQLCSFLQTHQRRLHNSLSRPPPTPPPKIH